MRVTSYRQIQKVLRHPDAKGVISDDELQCPVVSDKIYYLRPGDFGLMIFADIGEGVYQVHAAMVGESKPIKPMIDAAFRWMVDNAGMKRAIGPVRKENRKARYMAQQVGMVPRGTTEDTVIYEWVKNGKLS